MEKEIDGFIMMKGKAFILWSCFVGSSLLSSAAVDQHWSFDQKPIKGVRGQVALVPGQVRQAARFDGKGSSIDIPELELGGAFTLSAWVNLDEGINQSDALIGQGGKGQDINFYNTQLHIYDGEKNVFVSPGSFRPKVWYHLAVVRSDDFKLKVYVNGELEGEAEWKASFKPKSIGRGNADGGFHGLIDELRVVSKALSTAEVAAMSDELLAKQKERHALLMSTAEVPYLKGESKVVFDPRPKGEKGRWFTNDHSFVTAPDGKLHWFGINNPFPPSGKGLYRYHPYLGHLSTDDPMGAWTRHPHAIDESKGTEYVGAPCVIWHEESKRWAMVVETRLKDTRRLEVCWSKDLHHWERTMTPILPETLWVSTRDPHIIKGGDGKYWIHVVTTGNDGVRQSQIIRIKTKDFVHFEKPQTILGINDNNFATLIESPFIMQRKGVWYLYFTYAHRRYTETVVVVSEDPDYFDFRRNTLTTLFGHAAKVFSYKGKTYISSCGPEDGGFASHALTLAELKWAKQ